MPRPLALVAFALLVAAPCRADLIYQSATAVVTGTSGLSEVSGTSTGGDFYSGVNFELAVATRVTAIGGHFYGDSISGDSRIFGVLVATSSLSAAPTLAQVQAGGIATAFLDLPAAGGTGTVSGAVDLTLGPGTYGVYFGSGLFSTNGEGIAVREVQSPGYTGLVNSGGVETFAIRASDGAAFLQAAGARYFVEGATVAVPEPSSLTMCGLTGVAGLGIARIRRKRAI